MADERRRRHLGDAASGALPVLWDVLEARGWSHARLASELGEDGAKVSRLLYGDRRPGRTLSLRLLDVGVPIALWDEPLPDGWLPPHAVPDEPVDGIARAV